ncbi:MAG: GTPase [Lachnospiraceae bacterium]|nr:GTPase [Lachnospiraceae bacterium]
MKPVYVINGFLDSGKTEFITYTLGQPYFQSKGKTLIVLCEEGEIEYDPVLLKRTRAEIVKIEDQEEFNPKDLAELDKRYRPERIIIEWNGMWNAKEMKLPMNWGVEQQITCIDASTFQMYYTNMRSLLAEMVRRSEMIIFNRCDGIEDLASYRRNVKAVNPQADIILEGSQGEINEIFEDDLPYQLTDDPIVLDDSGYGIWYLDTMDHLERYENKNIEFLAQVAIPGDFPKGYFVPGRLAMTCCAEDMTFLGYVCKWDGADTLKNRDWVKVTAQVRVEDWPDYEEPGPVLYATKVEKAKAPKQEAITF